jgi:hypothetical protein
MTKNTKTILLSLLACLLLITGFELGAGRIRFGSAILNDSTASLITTNKGFLVNGKLSTSNYADFSNGVRFGDTDITIDDDGLDLRYIVENGGQHIFTTKTGTELATIDSAGGLEYQVQRGGDYWNGALLKTKFIRGISPTGNSTVTYAHGITDGRIISMSCYLRHDTTLTTASNTARNWGVPPNNGYQTDLVYYAGFDSLYVWARFPATSTATRSDSLYFLVQYWD